MAAKTYYELLEIPATASADEVKRAFRSQIAKYHPDKVQHLGQEFQAMAAERAAELTEAYRILSDQGRRDEYNRTIGNTRAAPAASAAPTSAAAAQPGAQRGDAQPPADEEPPRPRASQFVHERATRDEFVRKATMTRLRQALDAVATGYDRAELRGFDIALVPKKKLFGATKSPRLLGRFVPAVDRTAVADAWGEAVKWGAEDVCVLLVGTALAPAGELALEIRDQGRKQRSAGKLVLIPVDANAWDARMPLDAPPIAKTLLERLKRGS